MKSSILIVIFALTIYYANGQDADTSMSAKTFTISYSLTIESKKKDGLAESYNGAMKTIFISNDKVRSRLVSLMRVQSIFYKEAAGSPHITLVKESGDKYRRVLDSKAWRKMNSQYEGLQYEFTDDSTKVLDYECRKVLVHLKGNRTIVAYYTTQFQNPLFGKIEPAFAGLPGVVLKYEYTNSDAGFTYQASDISFNPIAAETYNIP